MKPDELWLEQMRQKFLVRLPQERAAMLALRDAGDWQAIKERAHKLAGISGMLSAFELGEAAFRLEERVLGGQSCEGEFAALIAAIETAAPTT